MTEFSPTAFYILAFMVVVFAIGVVSFKNLIHSALSMVLCFIAVAGIYILLHAELIAAAQVLIYVGAISILIIFAIMLTRHRTGDLKLFFSRQSWLALVFVAVATIVFTAVLGSANYRSESLAQNPEDEKIAELVFNSYAFPFEVVSLVLLVAIVGAVLLAKREKQ
ncbi:MAG: NADH-quinone oxidoreductase subunit J [Gaiellales bacterium]|nr:MAG: NADH-quinone oxidoreductase subunit J [Gaiellales bacterium]